MCKSVLKRTLALALCFVLIFSIAASASAYDFPLNQVTDKSDDELIEYLMTGDNHRFLMHWYDLAHYCGFDVQDNESNHNLPFTSWADLTTGGGNPQVSKVADDWQFIVKEDTGGKDIVITFINPHFELLSPTNYGNMTSVNTNTPPASTYRFANWTDSEVESTNSYKSTISTSLSQTTSTNMSHAVGSTITVGGTIKVVEVSVALSYTFTHTTEKSQTLGSTSTEEIGLASTVKLKPYTYADMDISDTIARNEMSYVGKAQLVYDVRIQGDMRDGDEDAINETYNKVQGITPDDEVLVFGFADNKTAIDSVQDALNAYNDTNSNNNYGGNADGFTWIDFSRSDSGDVAQAYNLRQSLRNLKNNYGEITAIYDGTYIFDSTIKMQRISSMKSLLALQDMQIVSDGIQIAEGGEYNITSLLVNTKDAHGNSPYIGFNSMEKKWYLDKDGTYSGYSDAEQFFDNLPQSDGAAEIRTNPTTGQIYIKGLDEGETYLNLAVFYENPAADFAPTTLTTADTMNKLVKVTVIGAPKASNITLSGNIDDYYLTSPTDDYEITLPGSLKVSARDQFGQPYPSLNEVNCGWAVEAPSDVNPIELTAAEYTADEPGVYYLYAVDPATGAYSNALSFEVFTAPKPSSISLSGELDNRKLCFGDTTVTFDLSELTVTAIDQYNNPNDAVDETNCEWDIYFPQVDGTTADDFFTLSGTNLLIKKAGSYGAQAKYYDADAGEYILSPEIIYFSVGEAPIAAAISFDDENLTVAENGSGYGLDSLPVTVLDQYGDAMDYDLVKDDLVFTVENSSIATISGKTLTPVFPGQTTLTVAYTTASDDVLCTDEIPLIVTATASPVTINWKDAVGPLYLDGIFEVDLCTIALDIRDRNGNAFLYDPTDINWAIVEGHEGADPVAKLDGATLSALKEGSFKLQAGIKTGNGNQSIYTIAKSVEVLGESPYLAEIKILSLDPNGFSSTFLGKSFAFADIFQKFGYDQYGNEINLSLYASPKWESDSSVIRVSDDCINFFAAYTGAAGLTFSAINEKGDKILSNAMLVSVLEAPKLSSLVVTGFDALPVENVSYDLSNLTVSGLDQYGNDFAIANPSNIAFKITEGALHASISGDTLRFVSNGRVAFIAYMTNTQSIVSAPIKATIGEDIRLNTLALSNPSGMIRVNGSPLNLDTLTVIGRDQKGNSFPIDRSLVTFRIVSGSGTLDASVNGSPVDRLYAIGDGIISFAALYNGVESNAVDIIAIKDYIADITEIQLDKQLLTELEGNKEYSLEDLLKIMAKKATGDVELNYYDVIVNVTGGSITRGVVKTNSSGINLTLRVIYKNLNGTTIESDLATFNVKRTSGGGGGGGTTTIGDDETPLVKAVSFNAFINGYVDGNFYGDSLITREQFVAILYRLNAKSFAPADTTSPSFDDVVAGRWSYDAIEWAFEEKIIDADANGNFRPDDPLTRAEMAVILVKCIAELDESAPNSFTDLEGHKDIDYILKAVKSGIFKGYPDGSFAPNGNTTRSEAVAALIRYLLDGEPTDEMLEGLTMPFLDVPKTYWAYKYVMLATHGFTGTVA